MASILLRPMTMCSRQVNNLCNGLHLRSNVSPVVQSSNPIQWSSPLLQTPFAKAFLKEFLYILLIFFFFFFFFLRFCTRCKIMDSICISQSVNQSGISWEWYYAWTHKENVTGITHVDNVRMCACYWDRRNENVKEMRDTWLWLTWIIDTV